jgi:hypothetical protein
MNRSDAGKTRRGQTSPLHDVVPASPPPMQRTAKTAQGQTAPPDRTEPQPWRTPQAAEGWRVVARGRGKPGRPPLMRLVVDLDDEQSAWVRAEADRTGLDYIAVVKRLLDEKRTAAKPRAGRRTA